MQTALSNVWHDFFNTYGPYSFTILLLFYLWASENLNLPKWLSLRKNGVTVQKIADNHIPHLESDIKEIKQDMKDMKSELHEYIMDVKKSAHARMDRMETRIDGR